MIRGIHHVAISTPDMERSVKFYRDVLGFEQRFEGSWDKGDKETDRIQGLKDSSANLTMLQSHSIFIEIFEFLSPEPKPGDPNRPACDHGLTHICLEVDDIEAEIQRLTEAGMRFHGRFRDATDLGVKATYGRDPDGNIIELLEMVTDDVVPRLPARD
jgi:catechol 2,3-dioxygenase-like lactoylglutathione lyase family enzyme